MRPSWHRPRGWPAAVVSIFVVLWVGAGVAAGGGSALSCVGLTPPVAGGVVQPFAPVGRYAGHWGLDLAAPHGSEVVAAAPGVVTFAGVVAENLAVTIDHGGGLRTSYSYLSARSVARGQTVGRGHVVGATGAAHDLEALHFSVRIDGVYVDPAPLMGCVARAPSDGLALVGSA